MQVPLGIVNSDASGFIRSVHERSVDVAPICGVRADFSCVELSSGASPFRGDRVLQILIRVHEIEETRNTVLRFPRGELRCGAGALCVNGSELDWKRNSNVVK